MAARQPQFSPKQIAAALLVSESSVKRWCDGGTISTVRTLGGHRRITLEGLEQFLSQSGRTLPSPEALGLPNRLASRNPSIPGSDETLNRDFRESLATGDEARCREILRDRISSGWSRTEAAENLITDALQGIGVAWQCNELDIYQERRGCDICIRLINELRASIPPLPDDAPIAIGGAPEGDPYQIPTVMVELALREVGWNAISLGNHVPLESFQQAVHDYNPQLVWLSVSTVPDPAMFIIRANRLAEQLGDDVPLLVGGRGLCDAIRPRLRYTAHCDSLRHLVDLATKMRLSSSREASSGLTPSAS